MNIGLQATALAQCIAVVRLRNHLESAHGVEYELTDLQGSEFIRKENVLMDICKGAVGHVGVAYAAPPTGLCLSGVGYDQCVYQCHESSF